MSLRPIEDTSAPYPKWSIKQLSDYIEFLELYCKEEESLFRGQAADWGLQPKLGRLLVPQGESLLEIEDAMLSHFERAIAAYLPSPPASRWELSALAQHHGMATRLLDWTLNPLAALWFALEKPAMPDSPIAVVWMFCPQKSDFTSFSDSTPMTISSIQYWKPRHISPRIRAQGSVFTVHPFEVKSGKIASLQEAVEHQSKLTKIIIPKEAFRGIRYQLDRCGINAAVIYPEVDGLARHIEWLYTYGYASSADSAGVGSKSDGSRQSDTKRPGTLPIGGV